MSGLLRRDADTKPTDSRYSTYRLVSVKWHRGDAAATKRGDPVAHRAAARTLFLRDGVDATSTEAILTEAGISRGALYHHFPSKRDVLAAVYELEAADVIGGQSRAPSRRNRRSTRSSARLSPGFARRATRTSPVSSSRTVQASLGIQQCREIEARHSLGRTMSGIEAAQDAGEVEVRRSSSPPEC
jgi:AcrR family transcriptional regulator